MNEACLFELKIWREKTTLFVQQITPPYYNKIKEFLRIDCYFRAHMEYKRPDVGLKIPSFFKLKPIF